MHRVIRQLILSIVFAVCSLDCARADIYLDQTQTEEIRLSNLPSDEACCVLISGEEPMSSMTISTASATVIALPYSKEVHAAASKTALDPALLHAVIAAESNNNPRALSPRGARGLMQLMPETARRFQVRNSFDPAQNVLAGAQYLKELHDMFHGDLSLTLAAYNAGPAAVQRFGGHIPPYAETRDYVPRVLRFYRELAAKRM